MKDCKAGVGSFNRRIQIQSVAPVSDGQGGYTETWTTTHTIWVSIEQKRQRERITSQKLEDPALFVFMGRYVSGINTKQRILYDSRLFNITRVNNINERGLYMEIEALEGVAI